ncbi:MAG TPA: precorrin-8X methylmutase [Dissulfurispiraceae bacterium]
MESIILIGHGSPKKDANNLGLIGNMLHGMLHPGCRNNCVRISYLQFAEPGIMETIGECATGGSKRIIIHPFFLSAGMHVTKDIPGMINEARALYPGVEFIYTEPLGMHEKLAHIVAERIQASGKLPPASIEKRSFEIISEEHDLTGIPAEQLPIVKRVIHATADFEFSGSLVFHPEAVAAGLNAIKAGKDIVTDIEMVKAGINKKRLAQWGGKVVCSIAGENTSDGRTRAERGIETALRENPNVGIIAIGNAPTALLRTIEIFNSASEISNLKSQILVVGVPVGFVKAFESKALLAAQKFPFIANLSRKGGTPVAVAIVNALLKMASGEK